MIDEQKNPNVPAPEDVPPDKLTNLSKKYLNWKTGMIAILGLLLTLTFLNTIVTNPTVSGLAVVDAKTQDTARLSNMTSILIVVFSFFALFLFVITRKLGDSGIH